ncbi:MAG: hypothetical protein SVR04_06445 [Spirochaetota bacterium]|nr:hypothetical protein [Spirochaetota bacterium]
MSKMISLSAIFLCLTTGFIWSVPTETELQDLFDGTVLELMENNT